MATPPKKRKPKDLNPRQRVFVKKLVQGSTLTAAAISAGYNTNNPGQAGSQALKQIKAAGHFLDLLDAKGLSDDVLIDKYLIPALEACNKKVTVHPDGRVDVETFPIWSAKIRALELLARIKGLEKAPEAIKADTVRVVLIDRNMRPPLRPSGPAIDIPTLKTPEAIPDADA
jgi:hypothetical protein